ncbi:MAG: DNA polymerase III subunit delta [Nitrospirae bacterium]|nr:DNA polymerase III subunit delta [Nitrospirota bacterium]
MTPPELARRLEAGRIDPLYVLTGEESWLVDEAVAAFRRHVVPPGDVLNTHLYTGGDITAPSVVAMAETLPAFAPRRLIVVRDADRLGSSDALVAYCTLPAPTTVLVFVMTKPDRRKTVVQALLRHAVVVACEALSNRALREWLIRQAAARGVTLTDEALAYLQERSGGSLRALSHDLEKVALSRGATPGPLGMEHLDTISPRGVAASVFEWAHLVAMGRTAPALDTLARLLRDEAPLLLLSILIGQWRKMIRCVALADERLPANRMAQALEVPPFAVDRLIEASKHREPLELVAGLTWCLETDAALKGGALTGALALERLVIALCRQGDRPKAPGAVTPPSGRTVTGAWWPGLLLRRGRRQAVGVTGQAGNQP